MEEQDEYFSEKIIWRCLIQCLLALDYLHSKTMMHRDIKSANILISIPDLEPVKDDDLPDLRTANFKLTDLNLSVISEDDRQST